MDVFNEHPLKKRRGRLLWMIAGAVVCLLVLFAGAAYYVDSQLQPTALSDTVKTVTIPSGSSVPQIAAILKQAGLIRNETLFTYYARFEGSGNKLQAGTYQFHPGQTIDQLLTAMANGDTYVETVKFTIPEGWNTEQIARSLEEKGIVKKQDFLREVNEGKFPEYPFVADIPQKEGRKYRLEGYLFPETYEFKKGATAHEVVAKLLGQFEKELKPEWLDTLNKRKLSLDDAVNLASIVEREVVSDRERPIVAGVFFNRMRESWLLQSCATVQFVLGKQRDRITLDDLKIDSPYNTYIHPGLPPGPIANPGRASLAAVVNPAVHDYFFFVTKKDGSSEHYFSKTYQEHLARDAKSRGNF